MSKKTKIIIAALAAVLLLGGGYYWSLNRKTDVPPSSSQPYTPPPTLGNLLAANIVKIETPGLTLEKNGEVWELTYFEGEVPPGGFELDQQRIISMTYSLANVWTDRLVEEEPEDISIYGLNDPSARLVVTDSSGRRVEYILGDMTPSMASYYIMQAGDPAVYSVASYVGGYMRISMDNLRQGYSLPYIQPEELVRLIIESPAQRIEIIRLPESRPLHMTTSFSSYVLTSPYLLQRGTHSENLSNLLTAVTGLSIVDFIDDNPSSLTPYGLNNPVRVFFQGEHEALDILLGNEVSGMYYAKFVDDPKVFTVWGAGSIVNIRPFSLIDQFALLLNIQIVEGITVSGGGRTITAELDDRDRNRDAVFSLNGRRVEDKSFRAFYQSVIGLLVDAEYRATPPVVWDPNNDENITIEYRLYDPAGARVSITLVPYNRDFYVLRQEGTMEFLISRNQVRRIFETADDIIYE